MKGSRYTGIVALCSASSLAQGSFALTAAMKTMSAPGLLSRDSTNVCSALDSSLSLCSNVDFCCPTTSTCIPLDQGLSVICCPAGQNCNYVKPIPCDTAQQNQTEYPLAPIHSSDLSLPLPKCLDSCCPLGFSCQNGMCMRNGTKPSASASSPSASTSITPVILPTATAASPSASIPSCKQFPAPAVVLGFFIGAVVGIILTLLAQYLLRQYQQKKDKAVRYSADFMGQTPAMETSRPRRSSTERHMADYRPKLARSAISDPMAAPTYGAIHRTDFLVRHDSAQSSVASHSAKPSYSSSKSATAVETLSSNTYLTPVRMPMPNTPENHIRNKSDDRAPQLFLSPLNVGLPASPASVPNAVIRNQSRSPAGTATSGKSPRRPLVQPRNPAGPPGDFTASAATPSTVTTATPATTTTSTLSPATTPSAKGHLQSPYRPRPSIERRHKQTSQDSSHTSSIIQDDDSDGGNRTKDGPYHRPLPERKSSLPSTKSSLSRKREPSTETINVLMPAPDFEESRAGGSGPDYSPYHPGLKDYWGHMSTQTTLSAMMEGAGAWQPRTDGKPPMRR